MQLYGALASPYVARVVLFGRLQGLELDPTMPEGGLKSTAYLARNPMGKMPMLEVDGASIAESEVICELLEDLHPGRGGLPGTPLDRARARTISRVYDIYVSPQVSVLFRSMNPATRDAATVATAKDAYAEALGFLGHYVAAAPFAAGAALSLADCTLLPSVTIIRKTIVPALGALDPTTGGGTLGRWWSTMQRDPLTSAFLARYEPAVDAFLQSLRSR
jgi:glutathione S-transferase